MKARCNKCKSLYNLDDSRIPDEGMNKEDVTDVLQ